MPEDPKVTTNLEEANEVGYLGQVPDPTPNEAYTVAGVTSSDEAAKADRKAASAPGSIPDKTETKAAPAKKPTT
jgi:hypothetical protein